MTRKDQELIARMVAEAVAVAVAGIAPQESDEDAVEVVEVTTPKRKSRKGTQSTKAAPKATAARSKRTKRGEKATEWVVSASWEGQEPSPRMLGAAVKAGLPAKVLRSNCKLTVSRALGQSYGLPIVTRD